MSLGILCGCPLKSSLFLLIYLLFFDWKKKSCTYKGNKFCANVSGQRKNHTETIEKLLKDVENQSANSDHLQQRNKVGVLILSSLGNCYI